MPRCVVERAEMRIHLYPSAEALILIMIHCYNVVYNISEHNHPRPDLNKKIWIYEETVKGRRQQTKKKVLGMTYRSKR